MAEIYKIIALKILIKRKEVLKKTGGKLNTDTLEFMRTIEEKEEQRSVSFFAAGWRYYQGEEALSELEEGQELYFKHEEDNLYDENKDLSFIN